MTDLETTISDRVGELSEFVKSASPEVFDVGMTLARLEATSDIVANLIGLALGIVGLILIFNHQRFVYREMAKWEKIRYKSPSHRENYWWEEVRNANSEPLHIVAVPLSGIVPAFLVIACGASLFDFIEWMAMLGDPRPYMLRSLL